MKITKRLKLNHSGIAHVVVPVVVVLAVAVVGTFLLVSSHAYVSPTDKVTSTYVLFPAQGLYKYAGIGTTFDFDHAECNGHDISNGNIYVFKFPGKKNGTYHGITVTCTSPKARPVNSAQQTYFAGFYKTKTATGAARASQGNYNRIALSDNGNGKCTFVHDYGISRIIPRVNNKCTKANEPDPVTRHNSTMTFTEFVLTRNHVIHKGHLDTADGISPQECNGTVDIEYYLNNTGEPLKYAFNVHWNSKKSSCSLEVAKSKLVKPAQPGTYTVHALFPGNRYLNPTSITPFTTQVP